MSVLTRFLMKCEAQDDGYQIVGLDWLREVSLKACPQGAAAIGSAGVGC